jgi:hypothetical protein
MAVLTGQTTAVFGLSFGPKGSLAAGTADSCGVTVWDVARRRTRQAFIRPGSTGTEPLFSAVWGARSRAWVAYQR